MIDIAGNWIAIIKEHAEYQSLDVFFVLGHDCPRYDNHLKALIPAGVI